MIDEFDHSDNFERRIPEHSEHDIHFDIIALKIDFHIHNKGELFLIDFNQFIIRWVLKNFRYCNICPCLNFNDGCSLFKYYRN